MFAHYEKSEDDQDNLDHQEKHNASLERLSSHEEPGEAKDGTPTGNTEMPVRNFDLNVGLDENGDSKYMPVSSQTSLTMKITPKEKHEEDPGWSLTDIEKVAMDPIELANISRRIDEDEEDYGEEEG